ncbi:MAG: DNA translocase FtsK 4TM domain-containing protein [Candidatus Xiphinematobacter sp.]|nr:MAG: DNA translocase FtsK 4TM domain-containing protein [Candidatus Xiphinematobacter sp.]QQY11026.1 MAG: DNA translocase FtsK 4TM domain-containing protein [Candidatus Xiphinematobacter sp.]
MNRQRHARPCHEISSFLLLGTAALLLLALISYDPGDIPPHCPLISATVPCNPCIRNYIGLVGAVYAGYGYFLFGLGAYLISMLLAIFGVSKAIQPLFFFKERIGWGLVLLLSFCALAERQPWFFRSWDGGGIGEGPGGWFGRALSQAFVPFGTVGATVVLLALYVTSLIFATGLHPVDFLRKTASALTALFQKKRKKNFHQLDRLSRIKIRRKVLEKQANKPEKGPRRHLTQETSILLPSGTPLQQDPRVIDTSVPISPLISSRGKRLDDGSVCLVSKDCYVLPPIDLLDPPRGTPTGPIALQDTQRIILQVLRQFSIEARSGEITKGPAITRYEIYPAEGIRVDRILSLEKDIARATRAEDIRILAPIPGRDTIGIEITNAERVKVTLRELLETQAWTQSKASLPIALGKDIYGNTLLADLAKMPHLLLAGTTGSGKSVCISTIIASLIFHYSPKNLRFIMIDPKVVELQSFNPLPHLITPVVTNPKHALTTLRWLVGVMENRYRIFAACGVRNIQGFNAHSRNKLSERSNYKSCQNLDSTRMDTLETAHAFQKNGEGTREHLEYIVVIIDELADLMQTASSEVESVIIRIAQMARAAGIHLIVSTQTPRVEVLTGLIKANIPSRIAFQVASRIDSRVILDESGAERLLGQGDMLYLSASSSRLLRAQGALVTDEEAQRLVKFISSQLPPNYDRSIQEKLEEESAIHEEGLAEEDKVLIQKSISIIQQEQKVSISMLQRRLRLGYTRAARILGFLERKRVLGPKYGTGDREILTEFGSVQKEQQEAGTKDLRQKTS